MTRKGLAAVRDLASTEEAADFYDRWAEHYEEELADGGYATPARAAALLAEHAQMPWAPVLEVGCGTGLGGLALRDAGFECIDGYDISAEMLARAREKEVYRHLDIADLSQPLDAVPDDTYQNAAAIGVFNPKFIAATVIDAILAKLPEGGCLVFSLNDHALADRSFANRVFELAEYHVVDLLAREHGAHIPGIGLESTIFVLRKR